MIKRLSNHIKKVIIQDHCCIIPFLGGFVCENIPAFNDTKKGFIMPPSSEIYFNRNLSHDDGLLQQSYANTYSLSMRRAKAMLDNDLKYLQDCLVKDKKVLLYGIGELNLSDDGNIIFNRICQEYGDSPMYGLIPIVMSENKNLDNNDNTYQENNVSYINIRVNKKVLNVAAVLISILFVLLPLGEISGNRDVYKAGISIHHNEKNIKSINSINDTKSETKEDPETINNTNINKDINNNKQIEKVYHVIVASDKVLDRLNEYKSILLNEGYSNIEILEGKSMNRLSICSFETESEAYSYIKELKKKSSKFNTSWVYKN